MSIGSMGESWRRIDGTKFWRKYCGGDGVACGFWQDGGTRGELGSGWMKVGGERNEKSFGTLESPSIVYNML